jgi:hypothetical protein
MLSNTSRERSTFPFMLKMTKGSTNQITLRKKKSIDIITISPPNSSIHPPPVPESLRLYTFPLCKSQRNSLQIPALPRFPAAEKTPCLFPGVC